MNDQRPTPPLWIAPAAVVSGLGLGLISAIVVQLIGQAAGSSISHPTPAVTIASDIVFDLCFVAAALYYASRTGRIHLAEFGFRRVPLGRGAGAVFLAAAGYYGLTAGYAALFGLHGRDKLPSELGVGRSTAALVAVAIFVCVIAPIAEEFFFRGFFFGVLRRWRITLRGRELGPWVAAILTGILFGLAHTGSASPQYLVPLGFLGFVLCLVRWKTGSLYPCMALHAANNSVALGANQLNWTAGEIVALLVGAWVVIGVITGPLAGRAPRPGSLAGQQT